MADPRDPARRARSRGLGLLLWGPLLTACSGAPEPPPPRRTPTLDRAAVRALREWALAAHGLRRLGEQGGAPGRVEELEAARARARAELEQALIAEGADPARAADEAQLLPLAHEAAQAGGRYAFLLGDDPASFSLVRIASDDPQRGLRLFEEPFTYRLLVHDETLVPDYPAWLAEQAGTPLTRPATWSGDGTVRVDRAAIERVGQEQFLPRVDALRAAAGRAADPASFRALATGEERLPELIELTRASLRWRSLEQLWAGLAARPRAEQLAGFVADYARRSELRAACELRELRRLRPASAGSATPLSRDEAVQLQQLGALSAMIHGEPLGVAADLLALAGVALRGDPAARAAPALEAARLLVGELAARLRDGPPSPEADALALWRLANVTPAALQAEARALHAARVP